MAGFGAAPHYQSEIPLYNQKCEPAAAVPSAAGKLMKLRLESGKMLSEKMAFRRVPNAARNHIFQVGNPENGYNFRLKNDRLLIFSVDLNRNETKKYERFRRDGRVPNSVRLGHLLFIKKAK